MNLSETAGETIASACSLPTWFLSCEIPTPLFSRQTSARMLIERCDHIFPFWISLSPARALCHAERALTGNINTRNWREWIGVWKAFFTLTNKLLSGKGRGGTAEMENTCPPALKTNSCYGIIRISQLQLYWVIAVLPLKSISINKDLMVVMWCKLHFSIIKQHIQVRTEN